MIDRDVQKEEWYKDTNATRLFLHLAFNAFYADGTIYKQGQYRFSVAELSGDLSLTPKQVRGAIEKLERYGVIKTETASKKSIGTLFTILKHVNFAKNEKANGVANERANAFDFQSNKNQSLTSQFSETMANEKANGVANERANQYENNIYKEGINNISSTSTRACTTADFDEMKGESGLIESIMMLNHVDHETVLTKIDEFKAHCIAGMKTFVSKGDLRTHFRDWVRIRIQAEKQSKQQNNNGVQAKYDPTGSYEPKSTREDYFL